MSNVVPINADSARYRAQALAKAYDVSFVVGPKDTKVYFNDTQFLTFNPDNVDPFDLERRIAFWSNICKSREFANALRSVRKSGVYEEMVAELSKKIVRKDDGENTVYQLNF